MIPAFEDIQPANRIPSFDEIQPATNIPDFDNIVPIPTKSDSLAVRGLKDFANIVPETSKELVYGIGGGKITSWVMAGALNRKLKKAGIKAPSLRETHKLIKEKSLEKLNLPEFKIKPAQTVGEKATDVVTGIGKFMTKLAVLKKTMPNVSEAALWEIENLSSGGTPGIGYAMHGAFSAPGKIIKGTTKAAKAGRVGLESAGLAGISALEQKIDTGEIDYKQVAIAAALPVALRTPKAIKSLIRKKDPKVIKAVNQALESEKLTGAAIKLKSGEVLTGTSHANILRDVKKSGRIISNTEFDVPAGTGFLTDKGKFVSPQEGWNIAEKAGQLKLKDMPKEFIDRKHLVAENVKFEPPVNEIVDWANKAKVLNKTERKEALKTLRKEQFHLASEAWKSEGTLYEKGVRVKQALKGTKAKNIEIEPLKLSDTQREFYKQKIDEVYSKQIFKKLGTQEAFKKMETGKIPTDYEFGLLAPVIGQKETVKIYEKIANQRPFSLWDIPVLARDILHSTFGYDPQAIRSLAPIATRHPKIYEKAVKANLKAYGNKEWAEKAISKLEASPVTKLGKEAYGVNHLGMTPWATSKAGTRLQYYGKFADFLLRRKSKFLQSWGRVLKASERGADVGINTGLNELVEHGEKQLNLYKAKHNWTPKQVAKWRIERGERINALAKRMVGKNKNRRSIMEALRWVLFSPSHTISRPAQRFFTIKDIFTAMPGNRTYLLQMYMTNMATLASVSGLAAWIGHKYRLSNPTEEPPIDSSINPTDGMFGKIRIGNDTFDLSLGEASTDRTLLRLGASAYLYAYNKLTDSQKQRLFGKKIPTAGESIKQYFLFRQSMVVGLAHSLLTKKDVFGRDISGLEIVRKNIPAEFLTSYIDAGLADGLWEQITNGSISEGSKNLIKNIPVSVIGLMGVGTQTYPVYAATTRSKYRDIVAKQDYGKKWDDLSKIDQKKLEIKHRDDFTKLDESVKTERAKEPSSYGEEVRVKEEAKAAKKINRLLSKANRKKIEGISLGVARNPKDWYLNDKRYNEYQKLVAKYLNEGLDRINLEGKSDKVRRTLLEARLRIAKNKALLELRRNVRTEENIQK